MKRDIAIRELQKRREQLQAMGARSLYMFGSTAQDRATETRDLDLFIEYDGGRRFNAFDLVGMELFLEGELAIGVDLTTRKGLHPALRSDIEASALRVF